MLRPCKERGTAWAARQTGTPPDSTPACYLSRLSPDGGWIGDARSMYLLAGPVGLGSTEARLKLGDVLQGKKGSNYAKTRTCFFDLMRLPGRIPARSVSLCLHSRVVSVGKGPAGPASSHARVQRSSPYLPTTPISAESKRRHPAGSLCRHAHSEKLFFQQ